MPGATMVPIQARISHTLSQRPWLRKLGRWIAGIVVFLLILAFASWLALPHFVKKIGIEKITVKQLIADCKKNLIALL